MVASRTAPEHRPATIQDKMGPRQMSIAAARTVCLVLPDAFVVAEMTAPAKFAVADSVEMRRASTEFSTAQKAMWIVAASLA